MGACNIDGILYELFVFAEWRPDPDFVRGDVTVKSNSIRSVNHLWGLLKPEQTLVDYIRNYIEQLQPWQICLSEDGKVLAVLQDSLLEIRTKRGNFTSSIARIPLPRDPNPQWRRMAWSPDCSILAVAHSNGKVSFYDLLATNLFDILPDCSKPLDQQCTDTTHAIAGIVFLTNRVTDQKWSSELLLLDYKGSLRSYFISPTDGFKLYHQFNFDGGAGTISYHQHHNMVFITGLPTSINQDSNKSSDYGIQGWRLLNDAPYYKLSVDYKSSPKITYTSWLLHLLPLWKQTKLSVVAKSIISPNGSLLACIHVNGNISIWQLPIIKLIYMWPLSIQPEHDAPNPLITPSKNKGWPALQNGFSEYAPIDINWWDDDTLILSRINGSLTICSISTLCNLLKNKPVFFQGHPQITSTLENGFLSLECESMLIPTKKLRRESDAEGEIIANTEEIMDDSTVANKISVFSQTFEIVRAVLYAVTDMERFQPTPKQLNLLSRVFRLLCLKSTTPEDLYARKIENAEYDEALSLADTYDLDSDHVYQQQWRCSKVSGQTIKDYLGKVKKKIWVIQQCCDGVLDTVEAAKELLEFGLKLTNKEIFNDLNTTVDKKTFYDEKLWEKITLDELSARSTEILRYRYNMLFYLDRLEIYKSIIRSENSIYTTEEYNRIRSNTICRTAIEYAKEGRIEALVCLWPHLCDLSLKLLILQNIPETLSPDKYQTLLPDVTSSTKSSHQKILKRTTDWCEKDTFRSVWSTIGIDDYNLEDIINDISMSPPPSDLSLWYLNRAEEIEKLSGLSQFSLKLIERGIEKDIPNLEELHLLLITLDIIVYEINIEPFTLSQLKECSQFQVVNHLMSKSSEDTIIHNIKTLLFPYLDRCQKLSPSDFNVRDSLFNQYILGLSETSLNLVLVVFKNMQNLGFTVQQCLDLAEKCYLAQETNENMSLCFDILEALPEACDTSVTPSHLIKVLDEMEKLLNASSLLKSRNLDVTYSKLRELRGSLKDFHDLLIRMARNSSKNCSNANDWNNLLSDIMNLYSLMYPHVDESLCIDIFTTSLIASGSKASIQSAEQVLTSRSDNSVVTPADTRSILNNKNKIPYKLSVSRKIPFERSVALVLEGAKEYYNSSSSLNDPALDLAWSCLQLIKEEHKAIQEERDLLSALKVLSDFELSVLPVQVRLYPSKIEFIEECLNCNDTVYKSVDKVLQLAKLLRIAENEDKKRETIIVSLCAIKAIDSDDFEEAKKLGKRLIVICEGPSAVHSVTAAQRLGSSVQLNDLNLRHRLLDIALLHCEPHFIEQLLLMRSSVEAEILRTEITNLTNIANTNRQVNLQDSIESTEDDYMDALTSPVVENKLITAVQAVEKYIHKPLSAITDKANWKSALSFGSANKEEYELEEAVTNTGKLACPCFYSTLHNDCHISLLNTHYNKFSKPDIHDPHLIILFSLVRNYILQDCIRYGDVDSGYAESILHCAKYTLTEDTAYCLSQMLSVSHLPKVQTRIQETELNAKNVHTLMYYYALKNYISNQPLPDEGFHMPPISLILEAFKLSKKLDEPSNDNIRGIENCKRVMAQLIEGKKLVELGCNVDIEVFAQDSEYRRTMIVYLSKTERKEKFELALNLAKKYQIDEQSVIISHLSYLILQHQSFDFAECMKKVTDDSLINVLQTGTDHAEKLKCEIWDRLDGADLQSFILYFTLLECLNAKHSISGLNAKEHLKLIKKVKAACPGINYKMLLNNPTQAELFHKICPLLTKDNIGFVTKLLRNLPPSFNINFNSSRFYCDWLNVYFFNVLEGAQNSKKWMQQYRECSGYFSKLNKDELLLFAKNIIFGDVAVTKLPPGTRIQIAFQTAEYCQHEFANVENTNYRQCDDLQSWEDVSYKINEWAKFLESFHSDTLKHVIKNDSESFVQIWRNFEQSRGEEHIFIKLSVDLMLNNDFPIRSFIIFLNNIYTKITVNELLLNILERNELDSSALSRITEILLELKSKNVHLNDEVLNKMKIYTTSTLLSSKQRLNLMSLYQIRSEDGNNEMLEKMSIEMIKNVWGERAHFKYEDINVEDSLNRKCLFLKLINSDADWEKLKTLVDLVNMWPSQLCEQKEDAPHLLLIKKLLENNTYLEDNVPLLKLLMNKQVVLEEDIAWITSDESIDNVFGKIWLCILSSNLNVYKNILQRICTAIKDDDIKNNEFFDETYSEILKKRLLPLFVNTKLYPKLVEHLFIKLSEPPDGSFEYSLNAAVTDLLQANHVAEAGSLKLYHMGVPGVLRGFSQSLGIRKFNVD